VNVRRILAGSVFALAFARSICLLDRYSRRIHLLEKEKQALATQISEISAARQQAEEKGAMLAQRVEAQTAEIAMQRGQITDANASRLHLARLEHERKDLDTNENAIT